MVGIGLVGYGYWGPNLARNFSIVPECRLLSICEQREDRSASARENFPACNVTDDFSQLLSDPEIDAVIIATPASTHFELTRRALLAEKDVLVEKPITTTSAEAEELVALSKQQGRLLAVDHTFLYTSAIRKIKEIIDSGELGDILYIDSVRTNLGLFQQDHNVIFDLAPHELSITSYLLDRQPVSVQALGACHAGNGIENLAYLHLEYGNNLIAHFHFNWLAPVKVRQTMIVGSRKMIVYDDMDRSEKIKIYDKGIDIRQDDFAATYRRMVDYRSGDMIAPHIPNHEALAVEAKHFVECVRDRKQPFVDGQAGLEVVRILEAAQQSLDSRGSRIDMENHEVVASVSKDVGIADDVRLGENVRISEGSNLYGCEIGDESMIGPFVEVQCGVRIGRRVKVQSHSFICEGVTLEDEAFIGHGVMFINDRFPRSTDDNGQPKGAGDWKCTPTTVCRRASIGSNATILCGVTIGEGAMVGAGSVVTSDVPPFSVAAGNPARVMKKEIAA